MSKKKKNASPGGPRWESPAREGKSAIGHSGSALPGQCPRFCKNRRSDGSKRILRLVSSMGWCRSLSGVWMCRVPFFTRKNIEKLESRCSLSRLHVARSPGIEKGALLKIVKGVFGLPDSPRGWWKELRDTLQGDSWKSLKTGPCLLLPA